MIYPYDYYYLWAAGRVVLDEGNVYNEETLRASMLEIGWPPELAVWGFTHPPWTLWLYLPFSTFSFAVASGLWIGMQVLMLFFVARSFSRVLKRSFPSLNSLSLLQTTFALFVFPPVLKVLAYGQSSVVLLFGLAFFCERYLQGRWKSAGLFLSLTLLKPHHLIPFYVVFAVFEFRKKRYDVLLWLTIGFLLQVLLSAMIYPKGYALFFEYVPKLYQNSGVLPGAALAQLLEWKFSLSWSRPFLMITACLLGLAAEMKYRLSFEQLMIYIVPLSLLATPYSFLHGFVLLAFPFLVLMSQVQRRYGERWFILSLLGLALLGIGLITFIQYEFLAVLLPIGIATGVMLCACSLSNGLAKQ